MPGMKVESPDIVVVAVYDDLLGNTMLAFMSTGCSGHGESSYVEAVGSGDAGFEEVGFEAVG